MSARELLVVNARHPRAVLDALRLALDGTGPAILPRRVEADVATIDGELLEPGAGEDAESLALPADAPSDACLVIETSGSTAAPKRVVLTARALRASDAATYRRLDELARREQASSEAFPTRQWLLALPVEYVAGAQVLARSIAAGTEPVAMPEGPFTAEAFLAACREMTGDRRYCSLVPAQLLRLLEAAEGARAQGAGVHADAEPSLAAELAEAVRAFDAILVGGQSTPPEARARAESLGWRIVTTYGSSETSGGCVYLGEPLPGVLAREEGGEILLSGPTLALGYLDDPERTADRFVEVGGRRWYRTGDAGCVETDAAGRVRVRVTGRLDDVIISGGEKVLLGAVEGIVRGMPGLEEAVVVGAPSAEWGEVPVVVAAGDADAGNDAAFLEAVRDAVGASLGRAARPSAIRRLEAMPLLPSGKPDRRAIAALLREASAADGR